MQLKNVLIIILFQKRIQEFEVTLIKLKKHMIELGWCILRHSVLVCKEYAAALTKLLLKWISF